MLGALCKLLEDVWINLCHELRLSGAQHRRVSKRSIGWQGKPAIDLPCDVDLRRVDVRNGHVIAPLAFQMHHAAVRETRHEARSAG